VKKRHVELMLLVMVTIGVSAEIGFFIAWCTFR